MKKTTVLFLVCCLQIAVQAQPATDKNKVMDYFQDQQFEEAIGYLSPFVDKDSSNLQILAWLGYASYMNDNSTNAKKYYQKILTIDSTNIGANHILALINSNSNPPLAQLYTRRLIRYQPGKASHYRNMGGLFKKINQKDSALAYYRYAYKLSPTDYKNATALADLLIEKKNYIVADSILENGLATDSANTSFLKLRIRSAYESRNYEAAILPGEKLRKLGEISLASLTQLAVSYYNISRYKECIDVCEFMLSNELDAESIYYYEAKAQAKLKNFSESNELLQICLGKAISKTAELYYYNLGENYEGLKKFGTAVKQYDSAFYLFKNPLMKYHSGRIYGSILKNEPVARKYYQQYIDLAKPQSPDEQKAYDYIKKTYGKKSSRSGSD